MEVLKSATDEALENSANPAEKLFANDLILRKICKFLNVSDMKIFRRVCWDFEKASQISFRAKTRIAFASVRRKLVVVEGTEDIVYEKNEEGETVIKVPADPSFFFKWIMADCNIPFTAVSFIGPRPIPWTTTALTNFFSSELGRSIRELKLDWPIFTDEGGNKLKEWDISPLISPSLKKLVVLTFPGHPVMSLSMDKLSSIDILEVKDCRLIYRGGKLAPKEISLENVKFVVDGNEEEETLVNKYIDFQRIEKLVIFGLMYKLDMSTEDVSLDKLYIYSTKNIENLENSRWTIENAMFTVDNSARNMKIKNFVSSPSEIDVSYLPKTIEKLYCAHFKSFKTTSTFPVDLPMLKYLELKCTGATIDTNFIPSSVNEIKIQNDVKIIGDKILGLDVVTFNPFNTDNFVEFLEEIQKRLQPKHIITSKSYFNCKPDMINKLAEFLQCNPALRITLGKIKWDKNLTSVQDSPLSKLVDEKAEFYAFENGRGIPCETPKANKSASLMTRKNPFSLL